MTHKRDSEFDIFWKSCEKGGDLKSICQSRTEYSLRWYTKKALLYKNLFYTFSVINIVAPLISSAVTSCLQWNCAGVVISVLGSSSASLLVLFNMKDKWSTYRTAAEYIKSQYTLYLARIEIYSGENPEKQYLSMLEAYMQNIHNHWLKKQDDEEMSKRE